MSTKYVNTLTIFVPEEELYGMNQLAMVFGESGLADANTFTVARYERSTSLYAFADTVATDTVKFALEMAVGGLLELERPTWDVDQVVDMIAAQSALEAATIVMSDMIGEDGELPEYAGGTLIVCNIPKDTILAGYEFVGIEDEETGA